MRRSRGEPFPAWGSRSGDGLRTPLLLFPPQALAGTASTGHLADAGHTKYCLF